MKRLFTLVFTLSVTVLSLTFMSTLTGCDNEGCTDRNACNFDSDAAADDGTCNYGCKPAPVCADGEQKFHDIFGEVNINCFDNRLGSPYQNQVFAAMTITQNRFQTCVDGQYKLAGYAENIIQFKNVTTYTITFDFNIKQNYQGSYKEYQGFVQNLTPGQVYQINTGDNTFYQLPNSQIQVVSTNLTYN
jgi:hypothetical protein